jgi:hypothetical protein
MGSRIDSGVRLIARLRHAISEGKKAKLKSAPALLLLRWAILSLVLTNVILAIIQAVVIVAVFDRFSSDGESWCLWAGALDFMGAQVTTRDPVRSFAVTFAKAGELVAYSYIPVAERVRLCMFDSGAFVNRATSDVVVERNELLAGVASLHSRAQSLQDLITAGTDPSSFGSERSMVLANFDNAPVVFVNSSSFESDPTTRRAFASFGSTSLLAPLGSDGSSVILASKSTTVSRLWRIVVISCV